MRMPTCSRASTAASVLTRSRDRKKSILRSYVLTCLFRPFDQKNPYLAEIVVNRELHGSLSDRSCKHIEFNIDGSRIRYEAGDHLGIFPTNDSELVEKIGTLLSVDLETVFKLINLDGSFDRFTRETKS